MRHETAFSSAMKKAGVDTDSALLYSVAQDVLRRNGVNAMRSLDEFMEELSDAGGLWAALLLKEEKRSAGLRYLNMVARDMRGKFDGAAVQHSFDSQSRSGPAPSKPHDKIADGLNESIAIARGTTEPARVTTVSLKGDGAAQPGHESQKGLGRSENFRESGTGEPSRDLKAISSVAPLNDAGDGAVQFSVDSHDRFGRPSFAPAKTTRFDRMREVKAALPPSIFDTMLLRDGTPLGELRWSQLDRFIATNAREAEMLRLVKNHAVPSDPNAKVRDVVKLEAMQRIVKKVAEMADA